MCNPEVCICLRSNVCYVFHLIVSYKKFSLNVDIFLNLQKIFISIMTDGDFDIFDVMFLLYAARTFSKRGQRTSFATGSMVLS